MQPLALTLYNELRQAHATVCTAESCTGGLISAAITEIPGSSEVFLGSIVAYANAVKQSLLGVSAETLERYGAVSSQTMEQMLSGVMNATGADCAMATSGIAGPGGGTPDKPVGTVWIGAAVKGERIVRLYHLDGNRRQITAAATLAAMQQLLELLAQR